MEKHRFVWKRTDARYQPARGRAVYLNTSLGIESFYVYLRLDKFLDGLHELSSRSEAVRSDAGVYACGELWYYRLSRSFL